MAIPLRCHCGRDLRLDSGLQGKRIRCPDCQEILTVPSTTKTIRNSSPPAVTRKSTGSRKSIRKNPKVDRTSGRTGPAKRPRAKALVRSQASSPDNAKAYWLAGAIALCVVVFASVFSSSWFFPEDSTVLAKGNVGLQSQEPDSLTSAQSEASRESAASLVAAVGKATRSEFAVPIQLAEFCQVLFPEQPSSERRATPTAIGMVDTKLHLCQHKAVQFIAGHTVYSESFLERAQAQAGGATGILRRAVEAARQSRTGSQPANITITKVPHGHRVDASYEYTGPGPAGTSVIQAYLLGRNLYLFNMDLPDGIDDADPGLRDWLKQQFFGAVQIDFKAHAPQMLASSGESDRSGGIASGRVLPSGRSFAESLSTEKPAESLDSDSAASANSASSEGSGDRSSAAPKFTAPAIAAEFSWSKVAENSKPITGGHAVKLGSRCRVEFPEAVMSIDKNIPFFAEDGQMSMNVCLTSQAKYAALRMPLPGIPGLPSPPDFGKQTAVRLASQTLKIRSSEEIKHQDFQNEEGTLRVDATSRLKSSGKVAGISRAYLIDNEVVIFLIQFHDENVDVTQELVERLASEFFGTIAIQNAVDRNPVSSFKAVTAARVDTGSRASETDSDEVADASQIQFKAAAPGMDDSDSTSESGWGHDGKFFPLPDGHSSRVSYFGDPVQTACIDGKIWDIRRDQEIGSINIPDDNRSFLVANPGQTAAAVFLRSTSWELLDIRLYSLSDPKAEPVSLEFPDECRIDQAFFATGNRLIALTTRPDDVLLVWDAKTGKPRNSIPLNTTGTVAIALSSDGIYLAVGDWNGVQVIDLRRSKPVAQMANPLAAQNERFPHVESLAFSADVSELAAVLTGGRLAVWSNRGKLLISHQLTSIDHVFEEGIAWLPDGSGWFLFNRLLVLRENLIEAMELKYPSFYDDTPGCVLDKDHLLVATGSSSGGALKSVEIPWDEINQAIRDVDPSRNAILYPGQGVSIDVKITSVRHSNAAQATKVLEEAASNRLKAAKLVVGKDQPVLLSIEHSETDGKERTVSDTPFGFAFGSQKDSKRRTVRDTEITCKLKLTQVSTGRELWSEELKANASILIDASEVNEQTVRADAMKQVVRRIESLRIPSRIANDPNQRLPVMLDVEG